MPAPISPRGIKLDKPSRQLHIEWTSGERTSFPWHFLRANCPSAGEKIAREEHNPLAVLGKIPSSEVADLRMVGNYALSITWADGHNAGIYTWEYLRKLSDDPRIQSAPPIAPNS